MGYIKYPAAITGGTCCSLTVYILHITGSVHCSEAIFLSLLPGSSQPAFAGNLLCKAFTKVLSSSLLLSVILVLAYHKEIMLSNKQFSLYDLFCSLFIFLRRNNKYKNQRAEKQHKRIGKIRNNLKCRYTLSKSRCNRKRH